MTHPKSTKPSESERARVLKRLKKILALSESDNPGEAATALHQARVLMQKYELQESDVALSGRSAFIVLDGARLVSGRGLEYFVDTEVSLMESAQDQ